MRGLTCAPWPPPRRSRPLTVFIPSTVITNEPGLQLRTIRASEIARAAAAFRVDDLVAYKGRGGTREGLRLFHTLLRYAVTPPHLKKEAFPIDPRLRYAGLMKPLQTPAHDPPERIERGSVIAALITECRGHRCRASLGRLGSAIVRVRGRNPRRGSIVPVRIVRPRRPVEAELYEPPYYWNLRVQAVESLSRALRSLREEGYTVIGTSRLGDCPGRRLSRLLRDAKGIALVLGGPRTHVWDEAPRGLYDAIINTVPLQGTRTVRTEEALLASLAVMEALA